MLWEVYTIQYEKGTQVKLTIHNWDTIHAKYMPPIVSPWLVQHQCAEYNIIINKNGLIPFQEFYNFKTIC